MVEHVLLASRKTTIRDINVTLFLTLINYWRVQTLIQKFLAVKQIHCRVKACNKGTIDMSEDSGEENLFRVLV